MGNQVGRFGLVMTGHEVGQGRAILVSRGEVWPIDVGARVTSPGDLIYLNLDCELVIVSVAAVAILTDRAAAHGDEAAVIAPYEEAKVGIGQSL